MPQLGFYFDMNRCSGCKCCQVACKETKNLAVGTLFRKVVNYEGGKFPNVWTASLSIGCNHCTNPKCLSVCPVAAISKDKSSGLVSQDQRMCIVCERCVDACPYGATTYDSVKMLIGKCDGCINFLELGEFPACVAACSTRCLKFGDMDELRAEYENASLTSRLPILPDPNLTEPNLLIRPKQEIFTLPEDSSKIKYLRNLGLSSSQG